MTRVVSLEDGIDEAVTILRAGGLVVHPTETVYGIGCALSAGDSGAALLRAAKGIDVGRPFLLIAADEDTAFGLWRRVSYTAGALAEAYWPGALSLVAAARDGLPDGVLGGGDARTIGVRVPAHEGLRRLLMALGEPMLSTSANPHGEEPSRLLPSALLGADLALDEGPCPGGRPSTILSTLEDPPKVLRAGPIPWPPPR